MTVTRGGASPPPLLLHCKHQLPSHTTAPKKILWRELLHRDWEAARLRLALYPGDAFYNPEEFDPHRQSLKRQQHRRHRHHRQREASRDGGVTTCLHVACRNRSPLDILRRLLELYPGAIRRQDAEGWTPLHTHILHGSVGTVGNPSREADFLKVFQMLLEMSLTRGGGPNTWALECANASPLPYSDAPISVASIHAHTTGAPLHLFCCHGHHASKDELDLVQQMIKADPSQVTRPDPNGCFPGTLLWRLYRNRYRRFAEDSTVDPTPGILQILFCFLGAVRGDFRSERHTLHDVLEYQVKYAGPDRTDFVRLYLQAFPESVRSWHKGQLPVHVACGSWPRPITRPTALMVWALAPPTAANPVDPLWRLLQAAPDTARFVNQHQSRLPLHCALAAPLLCRLQHDRRISRWSPPSCLADDSGLAALVQAHPMALATPDPVTGLPPAGLVAWVASQITVTSEKDLVGFIFSILRQCPCVLSV